MPDQSALRPLLAQKFRPLTRGAKVRVYASADGQLVLKTPVDPSELIAWFAADGTTERLRQWVPDAPDLASAARALLAASERSYRLAAARLAKEGGLLAVHLDPTADPDLTVELGDRRLDAARDAYILQARAELFRVRIARAETSGDHETAMRALDDLIALLSVLWDKGVVEQTANFHTNYGYTGERLILLDIGELSDDPALVRSDRAAPKVLRKKGMAWLGRTYPALAEYFARGLSGLNN